jgi:hypothetical protein
MQVGHGDLQPLLLEALEEFFGGIARSVLAPLVQQAPEVLDGI